MLYLLMHRRHTSASRDILLPKIAEQMPLRQQQGTWTSDSFPPGPYIISALTGEQRTGPSQLRLLPKGRGNGAEHPEGVQVGVKF